MARKPRPVPKICERCEAFFPSIASATCPQCFAPLTSLTEEEAMRAAEFQLEMLKDPEYLERKAQDDEKFKEQSFGACLAVVAVLVLLVIVSGFFISIAAHGRKAHPVPQPVQQLSDFAGRDIRDLLPQELGDLSREDVGEIPQTGTTTPILHARYGDSIQIYALPLLHLAPQSLSSFRLAVSVVDNQTSPPLISQEIRGKDAYYAIIGADGGLVGDVAQRLLNENM